MSGNTLGKRFCITTFGESHGPAIGCIVDGCPAGMTLAKEDIQIELDKRRPGQSHFTTQRKEADQVEILSGVYQGKTTGAPIALFIKNIDQRPSDYEKLKGVFRPGHGDYTYFKKYGLRDPRGGGRASARETAARVASGAIAQKFLRHQGIIIRAYLAQMGEIIIDEKNFSWNEVNQNPFFCPDPTKVKQMEQLIEASRRQKDSIGARVNVIAENIPPGLGEPVYDKLDADIAKALMSINAVKGVEIGDGFRVITQKGSYHRDEITPTGFKSNHAGGILAGISTGQPIFASIALKPPSSIPLSAKTINEAGAQVEVMTTGRHDACVGIRAVPVAAAMMALVIMDHWLNVYGSSKVAINA
ncbi:MAG: chorismate synthase [Proteobacteria bacterium]|nr:chorismate synthase [Pseudomonadota bacterium]